MELLPRQILDMESSLKDMRNLKFLKQQRGTHDDLEAALELSRQIEQQQLKVGVPASRAPTIRRLPPPCIHQECVYRVPRVRSGQSVKAHPGRALEESSQGGQ